MQRKDLPLRAIDRAVQSFVSEREPSTPPLALDAFALASHQVGQGHACLDLAALPSGAVPTRPVVDRLQAAGLEAVLDAITASPLVGQGGCEATPSALFVLDGSRLYLRRYWDCERAVIAGIGDRLQAGRDAAAGVAAGMGRLFPAPADGDVDWQRVACAVAAGSRFAIVTGGPGTGKTTTVVRMLGLLQAQAMKDGASPLRIRLACPTGKAAARLSDAIGQQIAALAVADEVRNAIPSEVATVHRLLGRRWGSRLPKHDAGDPLPLDVLVIDEASMVDVEMMAAVLAALPEQARLILLGDRDQLASVEAGSVFGDLCRHADAAAYDAATRAWIDDATGTVLAPAATVGSALDQHIVMLRRSHRFDAGSGIGQLAAAANRGDAAAVAAVLSAGHADIAWRHGSTASPVDVAVDGYGAYLREISANRPAADAATERWMDWAGAVVAAYGRFQMLAATREGPRGVAGLNTRIAAALGHTGLVDASTEWYEGRPVIVTRNDFSLGLMNGDVGITLRMPTPDGGSALRVAFPAWGDDKTSLRVVSPARLPPVETVFAMTVHKSQGSEFDHAALVLPMEDGAALSRELVYTAITRARRRFTLLAEQGVVAAAVRRRTQRASGIADAWSMPIEALSTAQG
jgi:exodeoxyribonuclease V alpha subunit